VAANGDLSLFAEDRLLEFQSDVFPQIRTTLRPRASATTPTEEITEAEEIAENLAEVVKDGGIDPRRSSHSSYTGVAEAVVGGPLIAIGQDGIGFAALFEPFLCVRVIGIAIRMKLKRQLAVGALDLLVAGSAGNPEDLVVIAFYVASQNRISPS
jgi:hypothetical protein